MNKLALAFVLILLILPFPSASVRAQDQCTPTDAEKSLIVQEIVKANPSLAGSPSSFISGPFCKSVDGKDYITARLLFPDPQKPGFVTEVFFSGFFSGSSVEVERIDVSPGAISPSELQKSFTQQELLRLQHILLEKIFAVEKGYENDQNVWVRIYPYQLPTSGDLPAGGDAVIQSGSGQETLRIAPAPLVYPPQMDCQTFKRNFQSLVSAAAPGENFYFEQDGSCYGLMHLPVSQVKALVRDWNAVGYFGTTLRFNTFGTAPISVDVAHVQEKLRQAGYRICNLEDHCTGEKDLTLSGYQYGTSVAIYLSKTFTQTNTASLRLQGRPGESASISGWLSGTEADQYVQEAKQFMQSTLQEMGIQAAFSLEKQDIKFPEREPTPVYIHYSLVGTADIPADMETRLSSWEKTSTPALNSYRKGDSSVTFQFPSLIFERTIDKDLGFYQLFFVSEHSGRVNILLDTMDETLARQKLSEAFSPIVSVQPADWQITVMPRSDYQDPVVYGADTSPAVSSFPSSQSNIFEPVQEGPQPAGFATPIILVIILAIAIASVIVGYALKTR